MFLLFQKDVIHLSWEIRASLELGDNIPRVTGFFTAYTSAFTSLALHTQLFGNSVSGQNRWYSKHKWHERTLQGKRAGKEQKGNTYCEPPHPEPSPSPSVWWAGFYKRWLPSLCHSRHQFPHLTPPWNMKKEYKSRRYITALSVNKYCPFDFFRMLPFCPQLTLQIKAKSPSDWKRVFPLLSWSYFQSLRQQASRMFIEVNI